MRAVTSLSRPFTSGGAAPTRPAPQAGPRRKPALRGVSHEIAAWLAVPASYFLWRSAGSPQARLGAAVYGVTLVALFAVSAFYHRPTWSPRIRSWIGRLDHSAIFLLIAGTYTPLGLVIGPGTGHNLLRMVWCGAAAGIVLALVWPDAPKKVMAGIFVLLGWALVPAVAELSRAVGLHGFLLILAGGLVYTAGAVVYAVRRPDPLPRVFGYHEVFHLLVIAAAGLHYAAIARVIA